jgi:serine/threonine-protein kinase
VNERDIFHGAREIADTAERTAYLEKACAGDAALQEHVEALLEVQSKLGSFLETPVLGPSAAAGPPLRAGRFALGPELARGGMGMVYRARDDSLGRDVAVKVLHERYLVDSLVSQRFLDEARITAQLQHPAIPPVIEVGRLADERPYLAMKLIQGRTLEELLHKRSGPAAGRGRFLAVFQQVCQAVGYAHSRRIVHRDLKPANVMVGAFGEVQVMDWGLAKVLPQGGVADEAKASRERERPEDVSVIRTARSGGTGGGTDTEAGSLLGTPAYMSPEQANGDVANLDRRADVFGLGAMLCEILTGQPPYRGRSAEEVRRKAANGDLNDAQARLDDCGADADLIALTQACLAAEAIDRPPDAQAVAEALTAYQGGVQDRLRRVELAEAAARAKAAEEAKRRRLTLALAATVLLALTLGGGAWLWRKAERDARKAQLTRDVNTALNQALALRARAKAKPAGQAMLLARAREQAQRAQALVENGPADAALKAQVALLQAELDQEEKDRQLIAALDEARLAQAEAKPGQYRFASERAVPRFQKALGAYGLAVGEGEPGAVAARIRRCPAPVREAIVAALDEWLDLAANRELRLREPHRAWLRAVAAAAEPDTRWARQFRAALMLKGKAKRRTALKELARTADVTKLSPRALTRLASRLWKVGAGASAVALLRRAHRQHPADFWINQGLAWMLHYGKQPELAEAVRYYTVAVAVRPDSPGAHINLGLALVDQGRLGEAIARYRQAIALHPKYAPAHVGLGLALRAKGLLDEAIACHRKAIALDPRDALARRNLGVLLKDKGRLDEAIACHRKAIALDPKDARAHYNLGVALADKGRLGEAIDSYRKALALDPKDAQAHNNLGNALKAKGRLGKAIACYRQALALDPKDAQAHNNLGNALEVKGRLDEAIACYQKAIALDPKDARAHYNLGFALKAKGRLGEAIACYRQAIALDPKDARAHNNLGIALHTKGRLDKAIACYRKALALDPKNTKAHSNLGAALLAKGRLDEAIASFRKALALVPKSAVAHNNLGVALHAKGRLDEAIACFRQALALNPKYAKAQSYLGNALKAKGRLDEAIVCYRQALALDPKDAQAHYNLGLALHTKGRLDEAIVCYRQALALDPKDAKAHNNLGVALHTKGRLGEAIACFRQALALDPGNAEAYCSLGIALQRQGRFAAALTALKRGHRLGRKRPGWSYPSALWVRQCRRLVELDGKLAAVLAGKAHPESPAQRLDFALLCVQKKQHAAAARFFAEAFQLQPKLAEDLARGYRYNAACAAALAAAGRGKDAGKLDDQERAWLRQQALSWLRANLAAWGQHLATGGLAARAAVQKQMRHWQKDADLGGIRDQAALAKLPAEERKAFAQLWADVAALLKKAEAPAKEETQR